MNFSRNQQLTGSPFIMQPYRPSPIDGNGGFSATSMATHPAEKVIVGKSIFVVDSRQRDCKLYPYPSHYKIGMGDVYKNVTGIELKGVILPKSSYNIHSSNNYVDFVIGDSVTQIIITNPGSGYTAPPIVTITASSGVTATGTAVITGSGTVASITITVPGSGYSASTPPIITIDPPTGFPSFAVTAEAKVVIGTHYTTQLREGNYIIGGNPIPPATLPTDLLLELQNAMNYAVNGGVYDPVSVSPFVVRLVSQYPELGATVGTPEAFDTNACLFNRVQIVNVNSDPWEILWCSGPNHTRNIRRALGFSWVDSVDYTLTPPVITGGGTLIPGGTSYRAGNDFDLHDDPKYVILSFWTAAEESFERVDSKYEGGLNRAFATLVYDANLPDNLTDLTSGTGGSIETVADVKYLVGDLGKGSFWSPAGTTKPLKGFDFDKKYLEFSPPIGKLASLNINFTKYGQQPGGLPEFYNFQGRDHMLIFEITMNDQKGQIL
jgi:hypothetical protein